MSSLIKAVLIGIIGVVTVGLIAQSLNGGYGMPNNGPCTPQSGMAGICSDSGIPSAYDNKGNLIHLPAPGPPGQNPNVSAGSTATLAPGMQATVKADPVSTPMNLVLDFGIPQGTQGIQGNPGAVQVGGQITLQCQSGFGNQNHTSSCLITAYTPPQ